MSDNQDWKNKDQEDESILENEGGVPTWFNWLFIGCIIIAFVYGISYTFIFKNSQELDYKKEVLAMAKMKKKDVSKSDAPSRGKKVFAGTCAACHGATAKGSIGPNLTDDIWLHGASKKQVFNNIYNGVMKNLKQNPVKGPMPSHAYLGKSKISDVVEFLSSINPSIK